MLHQANRNSGINLSLSDYKPGGGMGSGSGSSAFSCSRNRKKSVSAGSEPGTPGGPNQEKENSQPKSVGGSLSDKPDSVKPPKKRNRTGTGSSAANQARIPGQSVILPSGELSTTSIGPIASGPIAPVYNLATMSPVEGGLINTFELSPLPVMPPLPGTPTMAKDTPTASIATSMESLATGMDDDDRSGPSKRRRTRSAQVPSATKRSDEHPTAPGQLQFFPSNYPNQRPLQYHQYCPPPVALQSQQTEVLTIPSMPVADEHVMAQTQPATTTPGTSC